MSVARCPSEGLWAPDVVPTGPLARHRRRPGLRAGLVAALVAAGLGGAMGAAAAQAPTQSFGDLPGRPPTDPDVDPYPFDPFIALRHYLQQRLPAGWWAGDPVYEAGVFAVVVNIPEGWRGNPASAMLRLCPQPYANVWQGIRVIELRPFYRNINWPGATCRRATG